MTVLAGKNESGKSAILEALRDFDASIEEIPDSSYPLDGVGEPIIEVCFDVDKSTIDEILNESALTLSKETKEKITKNGLTVFKYSDGSYDLNQEILDEVAKLPDPKAAEKIELVRQKIEKMHGLEDFAEIGVPKLEDSTKSVREAITGFIVQVEALLPSVVDPVVKSQVDAELAALKQQNEAINNNNVGNFIETVTTFIPNFIFFSDFEGHLPYEMALNEAVNNESVKDFASVANIDLNSVIKSQDTQRRKNILKGHSATLNEDFKGYWKQDEIKLIADCNGDNLLIEIEEAGKPEVFKIEQRSKGLQWFLSFYLRLRAKESDSSIILIDEPGLYLHAKAQGDVLKVLEKISERSQVIFSTHSPYLIDSDRLDRVKLIQKDSAGSKVENKIHKNADYETITPIITAIGLDLSTSFSFAGKRNVILEGISDYYYLQSIKKLISKETKGADANLIPCVGAPKVPQISSLLIGWDLDFVAVLDHDTEGKKIAKELREKLQVEESNIIFISDQDGHSVEDLLSFDDFNTHVLDEIKNADKAISNSKFLKDQKIDKVLIAKKFFEKADKDKSGIKLSAETLKSFTDVFNKIASSLGK